MKKFKILNLQTKRLNSTQAQWKQRFQSGWNYTKKAGTFARYTFLAGSGLVLLSGIARVYQKRQELLFIEDSSVVYWKYNDIAVTEAPKINSGLSTLVSTAPHKPSITFLNLIKLITWVQHDDRIKGLYVDFSRTGTSAGLGFAQLQELRSALQLLKKSKENRMGKGNFKMVAFTDTFESQMDYFLATAFDEIRMEPTGSIPLNGFSSSRTFFKNLFEKLGVKMRAFAVGDYKSVISTYTESTLPEKQRENMNDLLGNLNDQFKETIGASRKISFGKGSEKATLESLMDISPLIASECVKYNLVDKIAYKRELIPLFKDSRIEGRPAISLVRYYNAKNTEAVRESKRYKRKLKIGVVNLIGTINRGDGAFGSTTVTKALLKAAEDEEVGGIVLRIDSGGGDVIASDTIWETVDYISKKYNKPVISSYGNVCASGGVYSSVASKTIFSNPGTITGSIGVAALRPVIPPEIFEKLGITFDQYYFSEGAKNASLMNDLGENYWERYKKQILEFYKTFKEKVSLGRNLSMDQVEVVAQGQVWCGLQASGHKLVDQMGGLGSAILAATNEALANQKIDIKDPLWIETEVFPREPSLLERLSNSSNANDFVKIIQFETSQFFTAVLHTVTYDAVKEFSPKITHDYSLNADVKWE
ncbi:hypothetical protein HDV06_006857 [Boothiomyces sp. JEL0866]|nr:hypothetical protein HDV06_006857 [Boothiomyces sp. JEL0866]